MNARERIMTVLHREQLDVIPFTLDGAFLQVNGLAFYKPWRKLLDNGLGIMKSVMVYEIISPNSTMDIVHHFGNKTSWSRAEILGAMHSSHDISGNINTPAGSLTFKENLEGIESSSPTKDGYIIKSIDDYDSINYLIENAQYTPEYEKINEYQTILGDYGICAAKVPRSPLQSMFLLMGIFKLAYFSRNYQKEFDTLYKNIYKKELEIYKIAAESPADVIWAPDNVTSLLTNPKLFEKYSLPFYNEVADIFRKHDKKYIVHMDGNLKDLAELIAKTRIDVIEGFTPPPTCDFPIDEARKIWKNKVIWANFPESISLQGQIDVRKKTCEMLAHAAPGDCFLMGITERFPSFKDLLASVPTILNTVNKHGKYPISNDIIE